MAKQKPRKKPDITLSSAGPDGKPQNVRVVPWDEAFGNLPDSLQDSFEYGYVHNSILMSESDRAVALLAPAWADALLEKLLTKALVAGSVKELLGPDGPLGSFSSRIKLSYAFGLLADDTRRSLETIRAIRNKFAHRLDVHTFETDPIRQQTMQLAVFDRYASFGMLNGEYFQSSRNRFLFAMSVLVSDITTATASAQQASIFEAPNLPAPETVQVAREAG